VKKHVLVLARRDHGEAMRVAAGLTIFGHRVSLVFMDRPVADTEQNRAMAELLELSDIAPETTVPGQEGLPPLTAAELGERLRAADIVVNV
jgi:hypothetical protein